MKAGNQFKKRGGLGGKGETAGGKNVVQFHLLQGEIRVLKGNGGAGMKKGIRRASPRSQ